MQSISAIVWLPTVALICGLVFGVLTLSCACLMIIKEQRPSGISILLAMLGALLLVVSIWQSRRGTIDELQAKIAALQRQNRQLHKELKETSDQQRNQSTTLSDTDTQMQISLVSLQNLVNQHKKQIEDLGNTQIHLNQLLTDIQRKTEDQDQVMQDLIGKQQKIYTETQVQLKNLSASQATKIAEHEYLLDDIAAQIAQFKTNVTAMSADHSEQLENLENQHRAWSKQLDNITHKHQTDLKSLREDVDAASSQDQDLNLIKASTQRELSSLRRELNRLQEHIRQLQGRRHRAQ